MSGSPYTQATLFFGSTDGAFGWSESWFSGLTDPEAARSAMSGLANQRAAFLSEDCYIFAARGATVNLPRSVATFKFATVVTGAIANKDFEPGNTIVYTIETAARNKRQYQFRGISSLWVSGNDLTPLGVGSLPNIDAYITALKTAGFGLRTPNTGNPQIPISSIVKTVVSTPLQVTTTPTPHGLAVGDTVRIRGRFKQPWLLGVWKVGSVPDTLTITLAGSNPYDAGISGQGSIQKVQTQQSSINDYGFNKVSFRKTGRPSFSARGKGSTRVLHH